jgi:dCMP deaminase
MHHSKKQESSIDDLPPLTVNPNRIELDEAYMQMAEVWAKRSKANRSQVGALIVKDRQIISDGYNGMPAGSEDDVCEYYEFHEREWNSYTTRTKPEVLHAESNALLKISENGGVGAQGATLYTTLSPCPECAKLIKQAKIFRVVYRNEYRDLSGVALLRRLGVVVEQLKEKTDDLESL